MSIKFTKKQENILKGYKFLTKNDYEKLTENQYLQFYNPKTKVLCNGKFIKFHTNDFIVVKNHFNDTRIYTINNYIIYYKPRKEKKNNERLFMEQLLNSNITINKLH